MTEPERPTLAERFPPTTVAEVVADLDATVALVLGGVKGDTDSGVVVPIWQLQLLLDVAREAVAPPNPHALAWRWDDTPDEG